MGPATVGQWPPKGSTDSDGVYPGCCCCKDLLQEFRVIGAAASRDLPQRCGRSDWPGPAAQAVSSFDPPYDGPYRTLSDDSVNSMYSMIAIFKLKQAVFDSAAAINPEEPVPRRILATHRRRVGAATG